MKLIHRVLAIVRLGDRRDEVESDFNELFEMRSQTRGRGYAIRRLIVDVFSVTRSPRRGNFGQDFRFGFRLIRKHPVPIGITVAGLALAIAVVTATFGIINAMLLRPFKMDDPSSVVSINRPGPSAWSAWPYTQFLHWKQGLELTTAEASLLDRAGFSLTRAGDDPASEYTLFVSGGYLPIFGDRARIGRTLGPSDDIAGAPLVAVVSHHFWTTRFNADESVVGRTVWIGDSPVTIVGVMDRNFEGPTRFPSSFWAPLASYDELTHSREFTPKSNELVNVFGRLTGGASIAAAQNELAAVSAGMLNWQGAPDRAARGARMMSARSPWAARDPENNYPAIWLLAIAGLVLVLACANAANLLLAGAASRMREMGVRLALGATRARLTRQLASESLLLGVISGALGFPLSIWLMKIAAPMASLPPEVDMSPDLVVLMFAAGLAIVTGIGAGLAPARYGSGGDVLSALKAQTGQQGAAPRRSRLRVSFIGIQAAVSIVLLVAASLLTRSAVYVSQAALGFDADKLLAVSLEIPRSPANYDRAASRYNDNTRAYLQAAVAAVRGLPSVEGASLTLYPPFGLSRATTPGSRHEGRSYAVYGSDSDASYFSTAGFRIVRGRGFTDDEANGGAPVALISESVARDFFGDVDPIGRVLSGVQTPFGHEGETTVIGVVADAMTVALDAERHGNIYRPLGTTFSNAPTLIVRSSDPTRVARSVEQALLAINPTIRPTSDVIGDRAERFLAGMRSMALMASSVAALAFVLAILGVYGVTAFVLSQRTQEIGVRMTMGATSGDILSLLIRQSLRPVVVGLAVGLAMVLGATRILASELAGVSPHDPIAIGLSVMVLLGGAFLAVIAPAQLAARTDPASVLRQS